MPKDHENGFINTIHQSGSSLQDDCWMNPINEEKLGDYFALILEKIK